MGGATDDDSSSNVGSSNKNSYINSSATTKAKHAKAQLGVLANATVKIYGLGDNTRKLLFTETTTSGSTIEAIGNFNAHENELLNDVYYLYEVNGGDDWDADDNGVVNQSPMENRGTFRAVIKGSTIKSLSGNITISAVSEILYTKVSDSIRTPNILDKKIEKASKEIIKIDLNSDGIVDSSDIVHYNPIHDEDKLHNTYKEKIKNIVDNIHGDKKIDIPTKPDEKIKKVDRKAPKIILDKNIVLAENHFKRIEFEIESESIYPQVELLGEDKEMFSIKYHGSSYYSLSSKKHIDFENPLDSDKDNVFNLIIKAKDSYGNTTSLPITVTIKDIADILPILSETYVEFPKRKNIEDDLINGDILIGKMEVYNKGDRDISLFKITSADYPFDNYYFRIDKQGNLYLKSDKSYLDKLNEENDERDDAIRLRKEILSHFNEEGYVFNFPIIATTEAGNSKKVDFHIVITTDKDYPIKPHVISHVGGRDMPSMISHIDEGHLSIDSPSNISVAPNGRVFVDDGSYLSINVDNKKDPFIENKYSAGGIDSWRKIVFSHDMSKVFSFYLTGQLRNKNSIKIRDFSDTKDAKYLGRIVFEQGQNCKGFELSDDGNTLFVLESSTTQTDNQQHISIYDVSDPSSPKLISRIEEGMKAGEINRYNFNKILLSSDGSKLYAYDASSGSHLSFYDVHDIKHPRFVKSIKFTDHYISFLSDSKDGSKLYVAERASSYKKESSTKLGVFDLSDINNPRYLNSLILKERPCGISQMIVSPDGEKLYVSLYSYLRSRPMEKYQLYIIDIKEPTSPEIIGTLSGVTNMENVAISKDGTTIYTANRHTSGRTRGFYTIDVREESEKTN